MPSADLPGVPTPSDEDYLIRRIEALERAQRELGPSLMAGIASAIEDAIAAAYQSFGVGSALVGFSPISYATMTVLSSDLTQLAHVELPSGAKNIAATGYVQWGTSAAATGSGTATFHVTREDGSYSEHTAVITAGVTPSFRLPFVVASSSLADLQTRKVGLSIQITAATFAADTYDNYGASTVFHFGTTT